MNNTAPFQGSNFIPTPTSLASHSQVLPAFAVPSHQGREAHPLQSQSDFKKTRKYLPFKIFTITDTRKTRTIWDLFQEEKKGKRESWALDLL